MFKFRCEENDIKKRHFFKLIFIYFLIPIAMISFSAFGVYKYYKNLFQKELESNYLNTLSTLAETMDNFFIELQNTTILLSSDKDLYDIFYSEEELTIKDSHKITSIYNTLIKFKATKNLIDSVYILHKYSDKALDISGTYTADDFFSRPYRYDKYNKDFWMNLKINNTFYSVLEPSMLESITHEFSSKRKVIPFVTSNNDQIRRILTNETNLKKDLPIVMPLASEQYLIKILTNSDSLLNEDVKNFIYNNHLNFKYSDFCVSLIEINFTTKYCNTYSNDEYLLVIKGISKMFERIAVDNYPTYVLRLNKNQLCLLINIPKEENLDNLTFGIKNLIDQSIR